MDVPLILLLHVQFHYIRLLSPLLLIPVADDLSAAYFAAVYIVQYEERLRWEDPRLYDRV